MKTNVKSIVRHYRELWAEVSNLNPAMKPLGSKYSWEDYYKAKDKARAFERKEVSYDESSLSTLNQEKEIKR